MSRRHFLVPSLLMAGFSAPAQAQERAVIVRTFESSKHEVSEEAQELFREPARFQLAGHRSHRSHSSHSSHRSSTGGGTYLPAPVRRPAPAPTPVPTRAPLYNPPPHVTTPLPRASTPPRTTSQPSNALTWLPDDGLNPAAVEAPYTEKVKQVQRGLKAFGYYDGGIDGVVGPATKDAIRQFQEAFSLPVTGTVTPQVLLKLGVPD